MRVCLIHGSTQSACGWDLLVHELMGWGVEVAAVELPADHHSEGAEFFADQVAVQLPPGEDPIVVAHSAAGLILPAMARRVKAARLVYVAAVFPLAGVPFVDAVRAEPAMFCPGWLGKNPVADHAVAQHFLFHDCDERTLAWALTTLRLWNAPGVLREKYSEAPGPSVPVEYVSCQLDRTIHPKWWERAAREHLGVAPIQLDCGHAPHVSRPRELARIIMGG